MLSRVVESQGCYETQKLSEDELDLDKLRVRFITLRKLRLMAGRRRLGVAWLILDPVVISLVYLFVFTVIRSNPNPTVLFIGISMFNIFSKSVKSGVSSISDFSGGLRVERVRTRVLTSSMLQYRIIDSLLQSIGVSVILYFGIGVSLAGILSFIILSTLLGIVAEGFGLNIAIHAKRTPDLSNIVNYILLLMFFGSPALYSMTITEGWHYRINEFNPFTYFVEFARKNAGAESAIDDLMGPEMYCITIILSILAIRGYKTLDKQRWEVSSWS